MKKLFCLLLLISAISLNVYSQKKEVDSLEQITRVEVIREKVQNFFKGQHKRFSYQLNGLNREYALYFSPKYTFNGCLDFYEEYNKRINLLDFKDEDLITPLCYYKPTHFEKPLNVPKKIINYSELLLTRTNRNWCEERFGYKDLEYGDEFGILLIFSPKDIPDSLSALKLKKYAPNEYDEASENKKNMMDVFYQLWTYNDLGYGLNERFITIVLKY